MRVACLVIFAACAAAPRRPPPRAQAPAEPTHMMYRLELTADVALLQGRPRPGAPAAPPVATAAPDRDHDRIPNTDTVVVVSPPALPDQIDFDRNSAAIPPRATQVVAAVASTLAANPNLVRIELHGQATDDEKDAASLAERRAAVVRAALIARGVAAVRLGIVGDGAKAVPSVDGVDHAAGRRVAFDIVEDTAVAAPPARHAYDIASHAAPHGAFDGGVKLSATGRAVMGEVLDVAVDAARTVLYRDGVGFHAVRLTNPTARPLPAGPLAVTGDGALARGHLDRLAPGDTALVELGRAAAATIETAATFAERPGRIVTVRDGEAMVEDIVVRTTRYKVSGAGATAYVQHAKTAFVAVDLPPGTIDRGASYALPIAGELVLEEHRLRRFDVRLFELPTAELEIYAQDRALQGAPADALHAAIAARADLHAAELALRALRDHRADLLAAAHDPHKSRDEAELAKQIAAQQARLAELRARLDDKIHALVY